MLADLPPSSRVTRLMVSEAPGADALAYAGRAGKADLGHIRVVDETLAHQAARSCQNLEHAFGKSRLQGDPFEFEGGQRGKCCRFRTTVFPPPGRAPPPRKRWRGGSSKA